jgi:hypothetical protein
VIAITRARLDSETRAYLAKKRAEGKSTREALHCLERHLARRFCRLLMDPSPSLTGFGSLTNLEISSSSTPRGWAAQIVSGIGFMGAELIFVRRDAIRGLRGGGLLADFAGRHPPTAS